MEVCPTSALIPEAQHRQGNDPIFELNTEAAQRAANGESILNATLGALTDEGGRLAIMPTVGRAFESISSSAAAGYAPISGVPAFLDATIQDVFAGTGLASSAVAVSTPGGTGAVYQAMMNFLAPGQSALTTSYFWGPYQEIAAHAGRGVTTFNMFDSSGRLDLQALRAGIETHAKEQGRVFLILNFPCHNPTGYSLDADEWTDVASAVREVAAQVPTAVMLDAAYLRFAGEDGSPWLDAVPSMLDGATVMVAWTASKSFAQYGARIGSLIALNHEADERERLQNALGYSCRATWSNCNHLGQLAIGKLLSDPDLKVAADAERSTLRRMLQDRVDVFNAEATGRLHVPRYDGGFFVSVFTPDAQVTAAAMRELGVYIIPLDGAVRVALCSTPVTAVPPLVEALEAGVEAAQATD